jgi:hypothetical protein
MKAANVMRQGILGSGQNLAVLPYVQCKNLPFSPQISPFDDFSFRFRVFRAILCAGKSALGVGLVNSTRRSREPVEPL